MTPRPTITPAEARDELSERIGAWRAAEARFADVVRRHAPGSAAAYDATVHLEATREHLAELERLRQAIDPSAPRFRLDEAAALADRLEKLHGGLHALGLLPPEEPET